MRGLIPWTILIGLLKTKTLRGKGTESALNKSQLLLGLFLGWSPTVTLVFLNLIPLLGAWLVGVGRPSQHLETLGRREEELFSVDSGSICGCDLAQAAGKLWV